MLENWKLCGKTQNTKLNDMKEGENITFDQLMIDLNIFEMTIC